jgi:hypothetical protein
MPLWGYLSNAMMSRDCKESAPSICWAITYLAQGLIVLAVFYRYAVISFSSLSQVLEQLASAPSL